VKALDHMTKRGVREVAAFTAKLASVAIKSPIEAVEHVETQLALARSGAHEPLPLPDTGDWRAVLHESLAVDWPCDERSGFDRVWETLASEGENVGRAHDGDPTLAEVLWHLVRHRRPRVIVETGVSRGITSRVILEALELNGDGHLWSIDLPPLEEPWRHLVGSAVPERLRHRWTYVRGTSKRRLRSVAERAGAIDLFVHDSLHTPENLRFEVTTVLPFLEPHAPIVIDDAEMCRAGDALHGLAESASLVAARDEYKPDAVALLLR
jgi:hypothetical protein